MSDARPLASEIRRVELHALEARRCATGERGALELYEEEL